MKKSFAVLCFVALLFFLIGCGGGGSGIAPTRTTDTSFYIYAAARAGIVVVPLNSLSLITGRFGTANTPPSSPPTANSYDFSTYTGDDGYSPEITGFQNMPVPEVMGVFIWYHTACATNPTTTTGDWKVVGGTVAVYCAGNAPSASPDSIDVTNPPGSITITGDSITTTYGTPKVQFYDEFGVRVAEQYATSYASNSVTISTPSNISTFYNGRYAAVVFAVQSDSSYWSTSAASLLVSGGQDPPPPDPPPCTKCGMTCDDYDCAIAQCQAGGGTWLDWGCVCQGPW